MEWFPAPPPLRCVLVQLVPWKDRKCCVTLYRWSRARLLSHCRTISNWLASLRSSILPPPETRGPIFAFSSIERLQMLLTPTELERLTIFTAAELARRRRARGLKLNYPEAVAFIADEVLEGAREGRSVADLISLGSTLLTADDVMPGVADMMTIIQVEPCFPDGTK